MAGCTFHFLVVNAVQLWVIVPNGLSVLVVPWWLLDTANACPAVEFVSCVAAPLSLGLLVDPSLGVW